MNISIAYEPLTAPQALRARLSERLPGMGVACTDIAGDPQALYPEEFEAIRNAVPRRQREFAAGRQAARQAMAQIGWPPAAIPSAADRSPIWPKGLAGSISHTRQACVAVVGPRETVHSIGIDLENDVPMDPALWGTICTPAETAFVNTQPVALQGRLVTWLFSAKEAFYKWQYPRTRRMLEFQDVCVRLAQPGFPVRFQISMTANPSAVHAEGHCMACHEHLVAWVIGHAPPSP
ncbi:MAG: 4'-phosphopantetheinyl transferase superfamily protein [Acidovorax sp.]